MNARMSAALAMDEVVVEGDEKVDIENGVLKEHQTPLPTMHLPSLDVAAFDAIIITVIVVVNFIPVMIGRGHNNNMDATDVTKEVVNTLFDSKVFEISLVASIACSTVLLLTQYEYVESLFNSKRRTSDNNINADAETIRVVLRNTAIVGLLLLLPDLFILFVCVPLRLGLVYRAISTSRDILYMYFFVKELRLLDPVMWRRRLQYTIVYSMAVANTVPAFLTYAPYEVGNSMILIEPIAVLIAMADTLITSSRYLYAMYSRTADNESQYFSENDQKRVLCIMYTCILVVYLFVTWFPIYAYVAEAPCYYSCLLGAGYATIYTYLITFVSIVITLVGSYTSRKKQASVIMREKSAYESLLSQMLPPTKVDMYLKDGKISPEEHLDAALFLSDIEGFTAIAARSEPYQVMEMLDKLYRIMDHVAKQSPRLYKLETIGDAYVITSGLFNSDHPEENAIAIANFALIVREAVALVVSPVDNTPIRIRIGIHSGDVMSGVIGDLMPRWCLFGDTMNMTSRLESSCESGCIHMSIEMTKYLKKSRLFEIKARGMVSMKGKGEVFTYNLVSATDDNPLANRRMIDQILAECRALLHQDQQL